MKISLSLLLLVCMSASIAQMQEYNYRRAFGNQTDQWHSLELPDEIFSKISNYGRDLRIYGITTYGDTIEAPYLYRLAVETTDNQELKATILNRSHTDQGYFFTLAIPIKTPINEMVLFFEQSNFDWKIKIEGSHDQSQWFTLVEDYRILGIQNEYTNFSFTKVTFPDASYSFFRVFVPGKQNPNLLSAQLSLETISAAAWKSYSPLKVKTNSDPKKKQTLISVDLGMLVPVSQIQVEVKDDFDFYRPVTISYLSDSLKTDSGWKYNTGYLADEMLNSLGRNTFTFRSTLLQKLTLTIDNYDNQPLSLGAISVRGYHHRLIIRFTAPATYFLSYGNPSAESPHYDLLAFEDMIPENLIPLTLGAEELVGKKSDETTEALFENERWLWGLMALIILVLGFFSIKMMKKVQE